VVDLPVYENNAKRDSFFASSAKCDRSRRHRNSKPLVLTITSRSGPWLTTPAPLP
jgi:hypothetical protein